MNDTINCFVPVQVALRLGIQFSGRNYVAIRHFMQYQGVRAVRARQILADFIGDNERRIILLCEDDFSNCKSADQIEGPEPLALLMEIKFSTDAGDALARVILAAALRGRPLREYVEKRNEEEYEPASTTPSISAWHYGLGVHRRPFDSLLHADLQEPADGDPKVQSHWDHVVRAGEEVLDAETAFQGVCESVIKEVDKTDSQLYLFALAMRSESVARATRYASTWTISRALRERDRAGNKTSQGKE